MRYFIKTEQEFIEEFGEKWRNVSQWSSGTGMDNLFGEEIPNNSTITFRIATQQVIITQELGLPGSWSIFPQMIKHVEDFDITKYNQRDITRLQDFLKALDFT